MLEFVCWNRHPRISSHHTLCIKRVDLTCFHQGDQHQSWNSYILRLPSQFPILFVSLYSSSVIEGPTSDFSMLLQTARTPIYDGASFLVFRVAMEIMNLQTSYGWSNASVDALLSLMGKMLLQPHCRLATCEEARKQMITLHGLNYVRIHACINDCVLFRGEFADLSECPKCGEARYRHDVSLLQVPRKVSLKLTLSFAN
jgi:hypothetical protein